MYRAVTIVKIFTHNTMKIQNNKHRNNQMTISGLDEERLWEKIPNNNLPLPLIRILTPHLYETVEENLRVCHDLDPRSYLQGQDHSAHISKILVQVVTSCCQVGSG